MAFGSILVGSPLLALLLGLTFAMILKIPENFINKSIGTTFLQIGIIVIGLTMSASNALEITAKYFPYISIFVLLVLSAGALLAYFLKVDKKMVKIYLMSLVDIFLCNFSLLEINVG